MNENIQNNLGCILGVVIGIVLIIGGLVSGLNTVAPLFIVFAIIVGLSLYFLPSIIAGYRQHVHYTEITLLNLLLGWTILGWIGLLAWAFISDSNNNKNTNDKDKLLLLTEIKDQGLITEEEYNRKKDDILKNL